MGDGIKVQGEAGCYLVRLTFPQLQEAETRLRVVPIDNVRNDFEPAQCRFEEPFDFPSDIALEDIEDTTGAGIAVRRQKCRRAWADVIEMSVGVRFRRWAEAAGIGGQVGKGIGPFRLQRIGNIHASVGRAGRDPAR